MNEELRMYLGKQKIDNILSCHPDEGRNFFYKNKILI